MDVVSTADASTAGASTADASRMRVGCVRAQEKSNLLRPVASHVQEGAERALLEGTEGRAGRGSLIKTTSGCEGPSSVSVRCRCRCGVGSESVRSRMRVRGGVKPFASSREMPHGIGGRAAIWSGATLGEQHGRKMRESCTAYACARVLGFAFGRVACAYSVRGGRVRKAVRE
jgi:hypothetical protein